MNYNQNFRPDVMNQNLYPQQLAALQAQAHYANLQQQAQQQQQQQIPQMPPQQQHSQPHVQTQGQQHIPPQGQQVQQQGQNGNPQMQGFIPPGAQQQNMNAMQAPMQQQGQQQPTPHQQLLQLQLQQQQQHQQHTQHQQQQQIQQPQSMPPNSQGQQPAQTPTQGFPNQSFNSQQPLQQQPQGNLPQQSPHPSNLPKPGLPNQGPPQPPAGLRNPQQEQQPEQQSTPNPNPNGTNPASQSGKPQQVGGPAQPNMKRFANQQPRPSIVTAPGRVPPQSGGSAAGTPTSATMAVNGITTPGLSYNSNALNVLNYRKQMSNLATLKFLDFCELVGIRSDSAKNLMYWKKIIADYFSEIGTMRYSVKSGVDSRQFEFSVPIIPRFFYSIIQSGVTRIEIHPGMLRTQVLANGMTYLESPRCCFTHYYTDGSYVNIFGNIKGIFNHNLRLDWLDFQTHVFVPGVEWPSLEKLISDETKMQKVFGEFLGNEINPTKKEKKDEKDNIKKLQLLQNFRGNYQVFHSMSNFGLQESVMRVMQVSDVMAHLKSLMLYRSTTDEYGPLHALDSYVDQFYHAKKEDIKKNPKEKETKSTKGSQPPTVANSQKNSPMPSSSSPVNMRNSKVPANLDLSQSTLNKRRRKSTVGDLSPKSISSTSPNATTNGSKKTKR